MQESVAADLAPTGTLRVAVWMLSYFAAENPASHDLDGVIPDLARELARRLGVGVELVRFANPAAIVDVFRSGAVDATFVGITADRAAVIEFGPVVVDIQTSYLVPAGSTIARIGDVDRDGVRIAVPQRSAQEARLKATLVKAAMIPVPPEAPQQAIDLLAAGKADAFSHVVPMLLSVRSRLPGSRILPGSTFNVPVAVGCRRGLSSAAIEFCRTFVDDVVASGFVRRAIDRMGDQAAGLVPHAAARR